jgi:hypothetical protein
LNGLDAVSFSVWLESDTDNTDYGWLSGKTPTGGSGALSMRYDKTGDFAGKAGLTNGTKVMQFEIETTAGLVQYETAANRQTRSWQHVVLTWKSGQLPKVYINGVLDVPTYVGSKVGSTTTADDALTATISGVEQIRLGQSLKDNSQSWDGKIDEFHLYNFVLSADQVTELMTTNVVTIDTNTDRSIIIVGPLATTPELEYGTEPTDDGGNYRFDNLSKTANNTVVFPADGNG